MDSKLLFSILSQPTAPFREGHVITTIRKVLDDARVPYFIDPVGNLVVGAASQRDYLKLLRGKSPEPLRVFIAHLDHPGFHGAKWQTPTRLEIQWHGGSPTQHIQGSKVWLADKTQTLGEGRFVEVKMIESGRAIHSGAIEVDASLHAKHSDATQIYGGFGFRAPVWQEDRVLYTKAADDLVGAFAIVSLALEHYTLARQARARLKKSKGKKKTPPFIGLLTRAEEVGFIGAIGHFELGWLSKAKREILCVSLETSRTLPGADIGKGPVVRLGDRYTVFSSGALRIFTELAAKILPEKHQRRVMDGGSCEATAATVYGFECVGISVPLGNYHNQSFEGGPDAAPSNGPAPEFVHLDDVEGLLTLCKGLLTPKLPWAKPWEARKKEFKKSLGGYRALLKSGP